MFEALLRLVVDIQKLIDLGWRFSIGDLEESTLFAKKADKIRVCYRSEGVENFLNALFDEEEMFKILSDVEKL